MVVRPSVAALREPRYAVRDAAGVYAIWHPQSGALVPHNSIEAGGSEAPVTFLHAEALAQAQAMKTHTGRAWRIELAPSPCPQCERVILADDLDFCYPLNRERTRWRAGCNAHDGGCGFELTGSSFEAVMARWNSD